MMIQTGLKRLIKTRPHMSTSRCGNICVMPPKCSRKERRCGFSNRSSVDAAMSGRRCVFLCESKSTLFGLPEVDLFTTEQHKPRRVQGWLCTKAISKKKKGTDGKTNLKAEARDYGKGRYISDTCLWCSANHNALGQLANQSRLCLSEGGPL